MNFKNLGVYLSSNLIPPEIFTAIDFNILDKDY